MIPRFKTVIDVKTARDNLIVSSRRQKKMDNKMYKYMYADENVTSKCVEAFRISVEK